MQQKIWSLLKNAYFLRALRVLSALFFAWLLNEFPFYSIESTFYDYRVQLRASPKPTGHVQLVAIDRETLRSLNREPNLQDHAELLKLINQDAPKAVVYTMLPQNIPGTAEEKQEWANFAESLPNLYVAINDIYSKGNENRLKLPAPFEKLISHPSPLTSDNNKFAEDSVSRRLLLQVDGVNTLHAQLAQLFNQILDPRSYRGSFEFLNSIQSYVDYAPSGTYKPLSFHALANQQLPVGTFTGKVVFIGKDTLEEAKDYIRTPYSKNIVAMSNLEGYANVMDTMIRDSSPVRTPYWFNFLMTAIVALLTVLAVWKMKPISGIAVLLSTGLGYCLFAYGAFALFSLWIPMAQPLLAIFICYYFFIPYRLIKENRRSWEYYQKNKLLMQVEELKTNFLSMMSHDLKTPLARIQGMAEMVLQNPKSLESQQVHALNTINKSSEELTYFISSILNLTRVESQEVKLHLQPKDINSLLEEVCTKYDAIAKEKKITLVREFEPLFSFKMDVDLMRQVLANLLENAIKYSPENTKVLVSTEEVDGQVLVQIADQGRGIPRDEVGNIFLKFYRSQDAKTSPIKGSGLGLYLAKYFVELHRGEISVESVYEQGSTFSIKLPTEQIINH
ncbi:MAG: ATP-binding protein [Bdellovibrionales bacterium]